eukprot:13309295-Alexandrium_andersonii.AAC.1
MCTSLGANIDRSHCPATNTHCRSIPRLEHEDDKQHYTTQQHEQVISCDAVCVLGAQCAPGTHCAL